MRSLVREAGLEHEIEIDSAGIGAWHAGDPPDRRATEAARARGITLEGAARKVTRMISSTSTCCSPPTARTCATCARSRPTARRTRSGCCASSTRHSAGAPDLDVPDPYYGGPRGFETVLDQVEAACRGLLDELR